MFKLKATFTSPKKAAKKINIMPSHLMIQHQLVKISFHYLHLKTNYLDNCVSITKLSAEIVDHYKQTLNSNIP